MINIGNDEEKLREAYQDQFPDGTLRMRLREYSYFDKEEPVRIQWLYDDDAELFALCALVDNLRDYGCTSITLEMPYIPHARMDKIYDEDDIFTLKSFAKIINGLQFDKVIVNDAHSDVAKSLIDRLFNRNCWKQVTDSIAKIPDVNPEEVVLCFADEGAQKRYGDDFRSSKKCFVVKKRHLENDRVTSVRLELDTDVTGKTVLIVDDICDYGTNFCEAAKTLLDAGAKEVYLYVTHCEDNILKGNLLKSGLIKKVFTTNSILHGEHEGIEIIDHFVPERKKLERILYSAEKFS